MVRATGSDILLWIFDFRSKLMPCGFPPLSRADCRLSPPHALPLVRESHFDLILLDIGLPEQSGIELCAKIREITTSRKTPIVFLTARDTVENRAQSSLHGGNDFITKPFNVSELTLKAQTWVYRAQFGLIN